ncbi:rhodanese-like domain-containing protein [Candidatus Nomurabacteria bacterium]|nr:MAG: rhodanese-like domain-containing protein [Candidatus Nomurabacteria bacterium]
MKYIIDVRTKEEFEEGAVAGAMNFDLADMMEGKIPELPKDAEIGLYCRSGGRSGRAKDILEQEGFTNVTNLGGLEDAKEYLSQTLV